MEIGLIIIFWYGVLHAFGPDHLTAIADFSIGKSRKKTLIITTAFAFGHGLMLFLFAKLLQMYNISEAILGYGDLISSLVIIGMGIYLLYLVYSDQIHLKKHFHNNKEHIHIWYGKEHSHKSTDTSSALTIGALMGIGGVRGMLVTLGLIGNQTVDLSLVLAFVLGVSLIFIGFGAVILYINTKILHSKENIRKVFTSLGVISLLVGSGMLLS